MVDWHSLLGIIPNGSDGEEQNRENQNQDRDYGQLVGFINTDEDDDPPFVKAIQQVDGVTRHEAYRIYQYDLVKWMADTGIVGEELPRIASGDRGVSVSNGDSE